MDSLLIAHYMDGWMNFVCFMNVGTAVIVLVNNGKKRKAFVCYL